MITCKMKTRMKREMSSEKPTVWVGKKGVSENLLNEIAKQLEKNELVKVKISRSILKLEDMEDIIKKMLDGTGSALIDRRGRTVVLYKPAKKKKPL